MELFEAVRATLPDLITLPIAFGATLLVVLLLGLEPMHPRRAPARNRRRRGR